MMEVIRVTEGAWAGWWFIKNPNPKARTYIGYTIPPMYKNFEHNKCYVHDKYMDGVKQLLDGDYKINDPYAVLHLLPTAPPAIIDAAFRALAKDSHPDRGGDPEAFIRIQAAYDQLKGR